MQPYFDIVVFLSLLALTQIELFKSIYIEALCMHESKAGENGRICSLYAHGLLNGSSGRMVLSYNLNSTLTLQHTLCD